MPKLDNVRIVHSPPVAADADVPAIASESCRDALPFAAVVTYRSAIGGRWKRGLDIAVALALAPVWAPRLCALSLLGRLRSDECITYGGRVFRLILRKDGAPGDGPGLLGLLHVLRGEMSLVGPTPLRREEATAARIRSHYLSARPGLIGAEVVGGARRPILAKAYAQDQSLGYDLQALAGAMARRKRNGAERP